MFNSNDDRVVVLVTELLRSEASNQLLKYLYAGRRQLAAWHLPALTA